MNFKLIFLLSILIPNLLLWWLFATKIEKESKVELVFISIVIAACSNWSQWYFESPKFGGLSGIVYGLMGYLWVLQRFAGKDVYRFDPVIAILMLVAVPIGIAGLLGQFANYAHIGGLLCGITLAFCAMILPVSNYQIRGNNNA